MKLFDLRSVIDSIAEFLNVESGVLMQKGLAVLLIWIGAWIANQLIRMAARRIVKAADDGDDSTMTVREKRGQTIAQLMKSVGRVVIFVLALLSTLNVFMEITPLLAGAGIMGLAISFGAQSLVKDVISGFFILLENQFAVGDIIMAADKAGVVERMTMRVVQLRDLEGILHTIPNGAITVVSNRTRGWSRSVIEIGIAYGAEVDRALDVFRDEARKFSEDAAWKHKLDGPVEISGVESLADSGVVIRSLVRTIPGSQWEAAREYRRRIKNRLDQEGIEIPFPQRTMHVRIDDERLAALVRGPEANGAARRDA